MANSALLGFDPVARKKIIHHEEDGKFFVETRQDATHLVEAAKILAEEPPDPSTGFRFIGLMPAAVFDQAVQEGWIHDKKRIRQWLNDSDNRAFNGGRSNVS
jgi:hypothetical protein